MVLTVVLVLVGVGAAEEPSTNPHDNPATGVLRVLTDPSTRGQCTQCHPMHGTSGATEAQVRALFGENTNALAFWTETVSPCHPERPVNYPLGENDRLPDIDADAGYFEANDGGIRRAGVQYRGRWPGRLVFTSAEMTPGGRYVSPHAMDPDMPRRDDGGQGLCLNCHDPHGESGYRDLLVASYRGIGGHAAAGPPDQYRLCFSCHGADGPAGMDLRNRYIEDYYDAGLNGATAGHQIRKNPDIALSWPSHIQAGDMLSCSDCHNAHGSRGNNGAQPNGYLISDQRPGWSGLNNTLNDAGQARRFCLGCHIPADGIPGTQEVAGIVMNTLPDEEAHRSTATESCYDCHGRDYSSAAGHNVHNPLTEPADSPWGGEGW